MPQKKWKNNRARALLLSLALLLTLPVPFAKAEGMACDITALLTNGALTLSTSELLAKGEKQPESEDQYIFGETFLNDVIKPLKDDWDDQQGYMDQLDGKYNDLKSFDEQGIEKRGITITCNWMRDYLCGRNGDGSGRAVSLFGVDETTQGIIDALCGSCMVNVGNNRYSLTIYQKLQNYHNATPEAEKLVAYWVDGAALRQQAVLLNGYLPTILKDQAIISLVGGETGTVNELAGKLNDFVKESSDPPALVNKNANKTALLALAKVVLFSDSTEFTATYTKTSGGGSGGSGGGSLTPQVTEKDLVPKVSVAEKGSVRGASVDADKRRIVLDIQPSGMSREQLEKVIASTNAGTKVTYTYDKLSKDGAIATGTLLTVTTTVSGKKLSVTYTLIVAGDTNCDGKCSATDAAQIAYYYAGKIKLDENQLKAADLNNNASVNATDAAMAVAKFAQWDMATYQSKIK